MDNPVRVLLVEDNPGDVRLVEEMLLGGRAGAWEVQAADRLSRAEELLQARRFDVVLLDLGLPDARGVESVGRLAALSPSLPVVVLTGQVGEDAAVVAMRMGAEDYLVKGHLTAAALARALRHALERKALETALRESERRQREIFDRSLALIYTHDLRGRLLSLNPATAQALGYPPEGAGLAVGHDLRAYLPPEVQARFEEYLDRIRREGAASGDLSMVTPTGQKRVLRYRNVLRSEPGDEPHVIGFALDVTEEVRSRHVLEESEERYRRLFEAMPIPAWVCDTETMGFLVGNEAAIDHYGYSWQEMLAMKLPDLFDPEEMPRLMSTPYGGLPPLYRGGIWRHRRKDGASMEVELSSHALVFRGRSARCIVAEDVTERRRVETFKDHLIGLAAHELRSPLAAIQSALNLLSHTIRPDSEEQEFVAVATRNCERLGRLLNDLLDLEKAESGALTFDREVLEMGALLEEAAELSRGVARGAGVELTIRSAPPGLRVQADRERLLQVLANLLSNAVKFSPSGKTVTLTAARHESRIRVTVSDSGPGIPEDIRPRIFQKFARDRKAPHKGVGLGLAISKAIVESLGGRIGFETEAGTGTTFYFDLPPI